ncbi:MAG: hypothetical protein QOD09_2351 [Bradyrhizobium sp.]|jgi:hypothetical protein|nr:hypothetical protein [Bradyrhizobium sp.]
MLRKVALGLVAAACLGVMAPAPSPASAKPWGGGWGGYHHHRFGPRFGIAYVGGYADDGRYATRRVRTPYGYRLRTVNLCY